MNFMFSRCKAILLLLCFMVLQANAQRESSKLKISVLTCSPGEDLYSIFGHTAIRIVDSAEQTDIIFNYGTFDFYDPNFYTKFVKGKLNYFVSTDNPYEFFIAYNSESRNITEQVLNVSDSVETLIKNYLQNNILPENRNYKYDFLYNNCTTKIRDLLKNLVGVQFNTSIVATNTTFRDAIHVYLNKTASPWNKLGIDLLLGSKIDKAMTIEQSNFLPENLMQTLAINSKYLSTTKDYPSAQQLQFKSAFINPIVFFSIFSILLGICSFKWNEKTWSKVLVKLYVFLTGLIGVLLVFMWFGTDHQACANNYNLLWSLPTNIVAAFLMFKQSAVMKKYFFAALIIQQITLASWFFLPQELNLAFLPLILLNSIIYYKQI